MPINLPITDPHWYRHPDRACLGAKAEEFYELSEGETARARLYAATVIEENCKRCPVLTDCLSDALNREDGLGAPYRYGIQGGLTPQQRAVRARALAKPINHGTTGGYKAHRRRGEPACADCKRARVIRAAELRAAAKEAS